MAAHLKPGRNRSSSNFFRRPSSDVGGLSGIASKLGFKQKEAALIGAEPDVVAAHASLLRSHEQVTLVHAALVHYVQDVMNLKMSTAAVAKAVQDALHLPPVETPTSPAARQWVDDGAVIDEHLESMLNVYHEVREAQDILCTALAADVMQPLRHTKQQFVEIENLKEKFEKARDNCAACEATVTAHMNKSEPNSEKLLAATQAAAHARTVRASEEYFLKESLEEVAVDMRVAVARAITRLVRAEREFCESGVVAYAGVQPQCEETRTTIRAMKDSKVEQLNSTRQERQNQLEYERRGRYDTFLAMLSGEAVLVKSMMSVLPSGYLEPMLDATIRVLDVHQLAIQVILMGVELEVESTTDANTLFRGVSLSTRLLGAYTKLLAGDYLHAVLGTFVTEMLESRAFEYREGRMNENETAHDNVMALAVACETVLDSIINSLDLIPLPMRQICNCIQRSVSDRFPDAKYTCVGGYLFLRVICPALAAPSLHGLLDEQPSANARRNLVLVSSAIQRLANGTNYGQKEPALLLLNELFLERNTARLEAFFDAVVDVNMSERAESMLDKGEVMRSDLPYLIDVLQSHVGEIGKDLVERNHRELTVSLYTILGELAAST